MSKVYGFGLSGQGLMYVRRECAVQLPCFAPFNQAWRIGNVMPHNDESLWNGSVYVCAQKRILVV